MTDEKSEPRPLSVDIWNRPWPPKFREIPPEAFRDRPPPVPPRPENGPLPPPTFENRIALAMMVLTCLLLPVAFYRGEAGLLLPSLGYAIPMAVGVWKVRPAKGRERMFLLFYVPVLLQVAVYLLFWSHLAFRVLRTGAPFDPIDTRMGTLLGLLSTAAFFAGWVPSLLLRINARGGTCLLITQTAIPGFVLFSSLILAASSF